MRRLQLFSLLAAALACGGADEPQDGEPADSPRLPFEERALAEDDFILVSDIGDTLRFRTAPDGDVVRLSRYRRMLGGVDSVVVVMDATNRKPIESFHRFHAGGGSVTARIEYGRGFDGQARLTITSPDGERRDNIRTPPPALDAAQLPLVLSALRFAVVDSMSFNYVAPFEGRALAARLDVRDSIADPGRGSPVHEIRLRVRGLEERYRFGLHPPHPLLTLEEVSRNVTWTRPAVPSASGGGR